MKTYKIIRFFRFRSRNKIIRRGVSLDMAQAHCSNPLTHKLDKQGNVIWFDGYTQE